MTPPGRISLQRLARAWWRAAWLLALIGPGMAAAQERVNEEEWKRGYHGFTAVCRAINLQVVDANDPAALAAWNDTDANRSLLVAFGAFRRLPDNLNDYLRRGGAVLIASDRGAGTTQLPGLLLRPGPLHAEQAEARLYGYDDCPIVSRFDAEHPITGELRSVATNRPGALVRLPFGGRWRTLAWLPPLLEAPLGASFLAAQETRNGGKMVVAADQTVFANQMLFAEDNLRLALNTLRWLAEDGRTTVLILEDEQVIAPATPEQVDIEVPPPTPEQVRDALRSLPPEALVSFANAALTTIEEEGLPNDLIAYLMQRISPRTYRRLLIFASLGLLGLLIVHRLLGGATADVALAAERETRSQAPPRAQAQLERQQAAAELLERFRAEVAGGAAVPWKTFASRLRIIDQTWETFRLRRALLAASRRLEPRDRRYWTRRRLKRLDEQLRQGRRRRESGALVYRPAECMEQDR